MHARLPGMAFVIGCLVAVPHTALAENPGARSGGRPGAGDRGGGRGSGRVDSQARGAAPRGTTVVTRGTAKPATAEGTPTRPRRVGRPLVAIALPYAEAESNERGSSDADIAAPPSTAPPFTYSEPSSIQPQQPLELPQPSRPSAARGNLRLEIEPNTAQVYVDGFYVGTVDALNRSGTGLTLTAGWHRLEFRAPGYETPAINVTIEANRPTSYRGELKPLRP
jgi:PEGA domain-containing protein